LPCFQLGGPIMFMVRAFDDLGDWVVVDREVRHMNHVLGADYGLCECGCSKETTVSHKTDRPEGLVEGKPYSS
jgi:hypothetical protein